MKLTISNYVLGLINTIMLILSDFNDFMHQFIGRGFIFASCKRNYVVF